MLQAMRKAGVSIPYKRYVEATAPVADLSALRRLGQKMTAATVPRHASSAVPAGYTYLSQFIFHDFTWLDLSTGLPRNKTTGALDLASVIGVEAAYDRPPNGCPMARSLSVGLTEGSGAIPEDLPRDDNGRPRIADGRNDDYLPLAQIHLLMIKFYNAIIRWHDFRGSNHDTEKVRCDFVRHAQHVVIEDFLRRIIDPGVFLEVRDNGRSFIHPESFGPGEHFEVPLEFAAAAGRFGHSMIRDEYPAWNNVKHYPIPGDLEAFMRFSYRNRRPDDGAMRALEKQWVTNWRRLFDFSGHFAGSKSSQCLFAAPIGTHLMPGLGDLPGYMLRDGEAVERPVSSFNLASHTLARQHEFALADAQTMIAAINPHLKRNPIPVLAPRDLLSGECAAIQEELGGGGFVAATPLWFYILKEADIAHAGNRLGPLGSRLVMETVHAAIAAAEPSILKPGEPWQPQFPRAHPDRFTMPDLIAFSTNPEPGVPER